MNDPYKPLDLEDVINYLQAGTAYLDDGVLFGKGRHQHEIIAKQFAGDDLTLESVLTINLPGKSRVTRHFPGFLPGDKVVVVFIGSFWENRQGVVHSINEDEKVIRVYFDFAEAYADFHAEDLRVV